MFTFLEIPSVRFERTPELICLIFVYNFYSLWIIAADIIVFIIMLKNKLVRL